MLATNVAATANRTLSTWVDEMARMCKPSSIYWCDGSADEERRLLAEAVANGSLIALNPEKRPGSYYHRSDPTDVARTEQLTFVCTPTRGEAGPTNNWIAPDEAYRKLAGLFEGAMQGRTMYVVPYLMGQPGSPFAKVGIELTDSVYVALSMRMMTRMGKVALDRLGSSTEFNRGLHAVADCDPERRFICHFPQDNTIWSVGSGYGGNALLGKKCLALRIASYQARDEGWLAEHMMLLEAESPEGETHFVAAAFPSACGKTNFAMLLPPAALGGWKIRTIGDDIAWMRAGADGRLYAVNPEFGYFGVAPGTNERTNLNAMRTVERNSLFTNVGLTDDLDVWWEGMEPTPERLTDWRGRPWTQGSTEPAAHPNSRFTAPMSNNPVLSRFADDPHGVPISAIIFGGRRSTTVPLVLQSFNWSHGVYLGATMGSETTAAAIGAVGVVRRDPMAMLPFCGYDMGSYMRHWLEVGARLERPPATFLVNWFRKEDGKFLWPGYGENMRVLKWIIGRCEGRAAALETPVGWTPRVHDLDLRELGTPAPTVAAALRVDLDEWRQELAGQTEWFARLGPTLPPEIELQRQLLAASVETAARAAR